MLFIIFLLFCLNVYCCLGLQNGTVGVTNDIDISDADLAKLRQMALIEEGNYTSLGEQGRDGRTFPLLGGVLITLQCLTFHCHADWNKARFCCAKSQNIHCCIIYRQYLGSLFIPIVTTTKPFNHGSHYNDGHDSHYNNNHYNDNHISSDHDSHYNGDNGHDSHYNGHGSNNNNGQGSNYNDYFTGQHNSIYDPFTTERPYRPQGYYTTRPPLYSTTYYPLHSSVHNSDLNPAHNPANRPNYWPTNRPSGVNWTNRPSGVNWLQGTTTPNYANWNRRTKEGLCPREEYAQQGRSYSNWNLDIPTVPGREAQDPIYRTCVDDFDCLGRKKCCHSRLSYRTSVKICRFPRYGLSRALSPRSSRKEDDIV